MRNNPFSNDITEYLRRLEQRVRSLETKETGTIYLDKQIIVEGKDGVKTVIGDLSEYGEGSGIKQWIGDTTPPPVPTSPMVLPHPGLFTIAWDGANADGSEMVPDFSHLNVYGSNGTSTISVGAIANKDEVAIFAGGEKGESWKFWFTAVDFARNESEISEESAEFPFEMTMREFYTPDAPTDLSFTSELMFNKLGQDYASVTLTWNPVTTGENTNEIEIGQYEVWGKDGDAEWARISSVGDTTANLTLDAGSLWKFKVRAVTSGVLVSGSFSNEITVQASEDDSIPPAPSKPVVTAGDGFFGILWDGESVDGEAMPTNLERVSIYASNGTTSKIIGTARLANDTTFFVDGEEGETYDFWFVAVGRNGNVSEASAKSTGHKVSDTTPDTRVAAAPTNLIGTADLEFTENKDHHAKVSLTWADVTKATDGSSMEIDSYEIWGREGSEPWQSLAFSETTSAKFTIDTGSTWDFRVRAVSKTSSENGEFSSTETVVAPKDTTPPPAPSKPVVSTWLRTITVKWDGSPDMPGDFSHVNVYLDNVLTATLPSVGSWTSGTMPADVAISVAFTAVDRTGNESALSAEATITPQSNVDLSEITDHIDTTKVRLDNLGLTDLGEGTTLGDALASANTDLGNLDTELGNLKTDLDTAEQAIEDGKAIWEPLPGRIEEVEGVAEAAAQSATTARNEATAAAASAAEANARALSMIPNGSFEDDFNYWNVTGNATIVNDSYSGGKAARLKGAQAQVAMNKGLPVSEGQIWEISGYGKVVVAPASGSNAPFIQIDTQKAGSSTWSYQWYALRPNAVGDYGQAKVRVTIPDNVDLIRLRIKGSGSDVNTEAVWDDITLRDVTDVVRLEQAATAASEKADAVQADADALKTRAEALELAQGGIQTRLDTAEQDLATNAQEAAENLSALDAALQAFATDKANTAKSEAISAAATDAQEKADEAQRLAEAEALRLAQAEAEDARETAEANAAADALAKAEAARDAAIEASSTEAKRLADEAQRLATEAAEADATSKMEQAESDAASDAKEKADEALRLAKLDATAKADEAQRLATEAAEADATAKTEAAEARAATEALRLAKIEAEREAGEALLAAQEYADAEAEGVSGAALEAAKLYAEEQAEEARIAAEKAAALDASAKQEAAEANAAADAKNKADQALADAKADATAKADEAQRLATEAAEADATSKMEQAEADAALEAARVAKEKADQALADAKADAASQIATAVSGINQNLGTLEDKVDGKTTTFYGPQPTTAEEGDLWISSTGILKRRVGSSWVEVTDHRIISVVNDIGTIKPELDKKIQTYAQTSAPTGMRNPEDIGDLWIDTSVAGKNVIKRYNGSTWTVLRDGEIADSMAEAIESSKSYADAQFEDALEEVRRVAGVTGKTWVQDEAPEAGATYLWEGTPGNSTSQKVRDGSVVARNMAQNPAAYVGGHVNSNNNSGYGRDFSTDVALYGTHSVKLWQDGTADRSFNVASTYNHTGGTLNEVIDHSKEYVFRLSLYTETPGLQGRINMRTQDASGNYRVSLTTPYVDLPVGRWIELELKPDLGPDDITFWYTGLAVIRADMERAQPEDIVYADGVQFIEADRVDNVPFFYGDTPDDRANDLWIDGDGVPHRWDSATKTWVAVDDQRIIDAAQKADDAFERAEEAETNAEAEAKRLADEAERLSKEYAKEKSEADASAAELEAIRVAAEDAKKKADAAQAEAIRLAAIDAQNKADTAKTEAVRDAASAAQTHYDDLQEAADEAMERAEALLLKGDNLVVNGSGERGIVPPWSSVVSLDPSATPSGFPNAFRIDGARSFFQTEKIPVDPSRSYRHSAWIKGAAGQRHYLAIIQYDVDGNNIGHQHSARYADTETTLAADLNPGDTTVTLTDASDWESHIGVSNRYIGVWPYVSAAGPVYQIEDGYTRNSLRIDNNGGASISGNTVSLPAPWAGPLMAAGSDIAVMLSGSAYLYPNFHDSGDGDWEQWTGVTVPGVSDGIYAGPNWSIHKLRPGVASVAVGFLMNYTRSDSEPAWFTGVRFVDDSNAQATAEALAEAEAAQDAADEAQKVANKATSDLRLAEGRLLTAETRLNTLRDTTLPALEGALDVAEGRLDTAESNVNTLKNTTVPALQGDLTSLKNTTIPDLRDDLDSAEGRIDSLNNTTLPGLTDALDDAKGRLDTIEPVVNTTLPNAIAGKLDSITAEGGMKVYRDVLNYYNAGSSVAGTLVVRTNIAFTGPMVRIKFEGAELGIGESQGTIDFYAYAINGGTIHVPHVTTSGVRTVSIRLAKSADNKAVILLDPVGAATWRYLRFSIPEVQVGYSTPDDLGDGWVAEITSDLSEFEGTIVTPLASDSRDLNDSYNLTQEWRTTDGGRTLRGDKLEANSIKALQIDAQSIAGAVGTFLKLNADQITAGTISADQIDVNDLAAQIATIIELNADRITAGEIGAEHIKVTELAAEIANIIELNADRITSGSVTADQIDVSDLAADIATVIELNADRITAGKLGAAFIDVVDLVAETADIQTVEAKNVKAGTGTFDTSVVEKMYAGMVTANDVFARRMVVSEGNLFPDPNFQHPEGVYGPWSVVDGGLEKYGTGTTNGIYLKHWEIDVRPGEEYRVEFTREDLIGTGGQANLNVQEYNAEGTYVRATGIAYNSVAGRLERDYTVPEGIVKLRFGFYTYPTMTSAMKVRVSEPRFLRKASTVTIEDGAITADKITVTTDLTAKIVAGTEGIFDHMSATKSAWLNNLTATGITNIENLTVTGASKFSKAVADQMFVDMFAANKISSKELTVSQGNLVDDSAIEGDGWGSNDNLSGNSSTNAWQITTTTGGPGRAIQFTTTASQSVYNTGVFTLEPRSDGSPQQFRLSARVRNDRSTPVSLRVQWFDHNKNYITGDGVVSFPETVASSWSTQSSVVTAPSNARFGQIVFYGPASSAGASAWMVNPEVIRMTSTVHIADGAVIADKLASNAVETKHLVASETSFTKLMGAYQIKAGNIDTNSLTADEAFIGSVWAGGLEVTTGVPSANVDMDSIKDMVTGTTKATAEGALARAEAILLKGDNLVVNGSAELGNNSGWPSNVSVDLEQTPSGQPGAFRVGPGYRSIIASEKISVDPSKRYRLSMLIKSPLNALNYTLLDQYDVDGQTIGHQHANRLSGSEAKLTAPMKAGDTTIKVNSTAGFAAQTNTANAYLAAWPYKTAKGPTYQIADGYTRNMVLVRGNYVVVDATTLTLPTPWTGPDMPIGADLALTIAGGSYLYPTSGRSVTTNWELYSGTTIPGVGNGIYGSQSPNQLRPGCAFVSVGGLLNHTPNTANSTEYTWFTGVVLSDDTDARAAEDAAKTATESIGSAVDLPAGQLTDGVLAAEIKTGTGNARVSISPQGIKAYNGSGTNTVSINSDGSASFTGTITAGSVIAVGAVPNLAQSKITGLSASLSSISGIAQAARDAGTVKDTRNENSDPSYYYGMYPVAREVELKYASILGITGTPGSYVTLVTTIPWASVSGGAVKQEALTTDNRVISRVSTSLTAWGPWSDPITEVTALTDGWKWGNTTEIDGGNIRTNTIVATHIHATEGITSKHTITGAKFQTTTTANRGVKMDTSGIRGWDTTSSTTPTFILDTAGKLTATNAVIKGEIQAGTKITAPVLQTDASSNRGVEIDSSGIRAYDSTTANNQTFSVDGSTGEVIIRGDLASTGANATITGAMLQTTATASRGVKIDKDGLRAYNTAGTPTVEIKANGDATFRGTVEIGSSVPPSVLSGPLSEDQVSGLSAIKKTASDANATAEDTKSLTDGWKYSGKTTIDGGHIETDTIKAVQIDADAITAKHTITGALFQTETSATSGLKVDSTGLRAYNGGIVTAKVTSDGLAEFVSVNDAIRTTVSNAGLTIQAPSEEDPDVMDDLVKITGDSIERITIRNTSTESDGSGDVLLDNAGGVAGETGSFQNLIVGGENITDLMAHYPKGIVPGSLAYRNMSGLSDNGVSHYGLLQSSFEIEKGRLYRVNVEPFVVWDRDNATFYFSFKYTTGNIAPTLSSTTMWQQASSVRPSGGNGLHQFGGVWFLRPEDSWFSGDETTTQINFLLSFSNESGYAVPGSSLGEVTFWAEDMGQEILTSGKSRNEKTLISTGSTSGDGVTETLKTYTQTWQAVGLLALNSTGSVYKSDRMYQGRSPYYTNGGVKRGHASFSTGSRGQTLSQAGRAAESVLKIEVYVYFEHWHSAAGGTASVGWIDSDTSASNPTIEGAKSVHFKRKQGRWIDLTSTTAKNQFLAGKLYGMGIRAPGNSTSSGYYGYTAKETSSNRPKIRVTYQA